jgi:hypothetical protein
MSKIEAFLVRDRAYAPLLHGQGSKQDLDGLPFVVVTDFIDNHGVRKYLVPMHLSVQEGALRGLPDPSTKG